MAPKICKIDFFNHESFHDCVWDFNSCLNVLTKNGSQVDFRTAHAFPKKFEEILFLENIDYYSINTRGSVAYGKDH